MDLTARTILTDLSSSSGPVIAIRGILIYRRWFLFLYLAWLVCPVRRVPALLVARQMLVSRYSLRRMDLILRMIRWFTRGMREAEHLLLLARHLPGPLLNPEDIR